MKTTPDSFFSGGQVLGMIGLCGKPGAGKGIESLRLIIAELLDPESDRIIVTNCALHLDKITEFLAARGREDINVYERVVVLAWEETPKFYLRRSLTFIGEETRPDPKLPPQVDFSTYPQTPVLYVIDEAHEFFNSRDWQRVSSQTAVLAYVSKHRHLGDGIIWISQTIASIDKQFRERSQEYRITRNWAKERFGKFSKGTGFLVSSYLAPPTPTEKPQWEEERRPLPDFLSCYSTSLYNRSADLGKKVKGLNIRKWIFALVPLAVIVPVGIWYLAKPFVNNLTKPKDNPGIFAESKDTTEPKKTIPQMFSPGHSGGQDKPEEPPVLVFTPPDRWNPLGTPPISKVPKSEVSQVVLAPKVIPLHPIPFESSAFTGGYHINAEDGKRYRVGDFWHGLQITDCRPHCIITGQIVHPVSKSPLLSRIKENPVPQIATTPTTPRP